MSSEIAPEVRAYMSAIGSKKTAKKAASSRRNAVRAAAARRKDLSTVPCTCGGCPDSPKTTCPRGRLMRQRQRLAERKSSSHPAQMNHSKTFEDTPFDAAADVRAMREERLSEV